MRTFIVVPEGLATDAHGAYHVSDHYKAALDLVNEKAGSGDLVLLAPANSFGAHQEEDLFGSEYLQQRQCKAKVDVIGKEVLRHGYLDTLDNAVYLRDHLLRTGHWPLGPITLVCNRPHRLRSWLMFKAVGYDVRETLTSRALVRSGNRMVKRLWFYDVPPVQYFYELIATLYGCWRLLFLPKH